MTTLYTAHNATITFSIDKDADVILIKAPTGTHIYGLSHLDAAISLFLSYAEHLNTEIF
jgi:hypothetical protein